MSKAAAINLKHQTIIGQNVQAVDQVWPGLNLVQEVSWQIALGESSVAKRWEPFSIISISTPTLDSCKTVESLKFGHILPTESQKIWLKKSLDLSSQAPHRSFTVRQGDLVGRILLESDALHWWATFGGLIFTGHDFSVPPEKNHPDPHEYSLIWALYGDIQKTVQLHEKETSLDKRDQHLQPLPLISRGFSRWFPSRGGMWKTFVDLIMDPASFSAVDGSTIFFSRVFSPTFAPAKGGGELFVFFHEISSINSRWWFTFFFVIFTPDLWGNDPIWRSYFSIGLAQPPTRPGRLT